MTEGVSERRNSSHTQQRVHRIVNALVVVLLLFCTAAFVRSYHNLISSVQEERAKSVEQIAAQITEKVSQLRNSYLREVEQIARVVEQSDQDSLQAFAYLQTGENRIALVDESGNYTLLDGTVILIDDPELMDSLVRAGEACTSFATIQTEGDSWLFSAPLTDTVIQGTRYIGAVLIVDGQEYADAATITLYDRLGESLVVAQDGTIKMRPSSAAGMPFGGYNLLRALEKSEASQQDLDAFAAALRSRKVYSFVFSLDHVIWIIRTDPSVSGRNIVVAVPISLTAQNTYREMNGTLVLAIAVAVSLAALFTLNFVWVLRKNQQIQLENARAKSKSDFLDKMSHDIRTPMTAIVGMHELALSSLDDREMVRDCLLKAKKASSYLISVINDVLDMSRIESGKMTLAHKPFALRELLEDVIQMERLVASEKNVRIEEKCDLPPEAAFYGDAQRLKQCAVNLVNNAVKFTPAGGCVTVACTAQPPEKGKTTMRLSVSDTGIGMSEAFLQHVFQPFEQEQNSMVSAYAGSGLGLSIVREFVTLMGGTVAVSSKKVEGSTFTIELPLESAPPLGAEKPRISDEALRARLQGRHVLLAENNALNREILTLLLEKLGLTVDQAENGEDAVEKFGAFRPGGCALILMDIMMPVMNGLEAAAAIRRLDRADAKTVPIVALSANAFEEDAKKSLQAGMQMHLARPIDVDERKNVLETYIV